MIRKYKIKRTVIITTTDVIYDDKDVETIEKELDNGVSIAGEISHLGLAGLHDTVSYEFGDTVVEELNSWNIPSMPEI